MMYYFVFAVFGEKISKRWGWCPCMAINVSVQYNGGLLPDITTIGEPV